MKLKPNIPPDLIRIVQRILGGRKVVMYDKLKKCNFSLKNLRGEIFVVLGRI